MNALLLILLIVMCFPFKINININGKDYTIRNKKDDKE